MQTHSYTLNDAYSHDKTQISRILSDTLKITVAHTFNIYSEVPQRLLKKQSKKSKKEMEVTKLYTYGRLLALLQFCPHRCGY